MKNLLHFRFMLPIGLCMPLCVMLYIGLCFTPSLTKKALAWEATVEHVSDGDSFIVRRMDGKSGSRTEKVRLYGIDAPEHGQAFSRVSRENLQKLLRGTLDINVVYHDKFGRAVALVKSTVSKKRGFTVNELQIRDGMAWMYPLFCKESFCPDWKAMENDAHNARKGLWRDVAPISPWEWKRRLK